MRNRLQHLRQHTIETPASLARPEQPHALTHAVEIDTLMTHDGAHPYARLATATTLLGPSVDVSVRPPAPRPSARALILSKLGSDTLTQWVNEKGLSALEHDDRQRAAALILARCFPSKRWDRLRKFAPFGRSRPPANLDVCGYLDLSSCTNLTALPTGLSVSGGLNLSYCTKLTALPAGLSVGGGLDLNHCTSLTSLPAGLHVGGNLYLNSCTSLTSLPAGLSVGGRLELYACTNLTSLPAGLSVGGHLDLTYNSLLTTLPADLRVGWDLKLNGCTNLASLPVGLTVGGDLSLQDCTHLTALPAKLNVGGDLCLDRCTSLTSLPADLRVGCDLILTGCLRLTSLPDAVASWGRSERGYTREIDITGTGLTQQVRARLQSSASDIRVYYSEEHNEQPFELAWTLSEALQHFEPLNPAQALLVWPPEQQSILSRYLERLTKTADYQNIAVRPALMNRLNLLLSAACEDPAFRSYALSVLDDAMQTCGDRVILGLNTVELQLALQEATQAQGPQRATALRQLGLSLMKLSIVHAHAAQSCQHLKFVDEVEIYLAYETKLRERLSLPGKTVSMLYSSGVDVESFEAAAQDAEQQCANSGVVEAFYATWTPWQQHLRQTQAEAFSFEQIKTQDAPTAAPIDRPRICAITQEPEIDLAQPVYLGSTDNPRVYEYASLLTWWTEHGQEPAPFDVFTLNQLRRAAE